MKIDFLVENLLRHRDLGRPKHDTTARADQANAHLYQLLVQTPVFRARRAGAP